MRVTTQAFLVKRHIVQWWQWLLNYAVAYDELPFGIAWEGEGHHQGLARTHQLSDGSISFFLSHSETDAGDKEI